eukprot:3878495-Rhodomonas_salina.1
MLCVFAPMCYVAPAARMQDEKHRTTAQHSTAGEEHASTSRIFAWRRGRGDGRGGGAREEGEEVCCGTFHLRRRRGREEERRRGGAGVSGREKRGRKGRER